MKFERSFKGEGGAIERAVEALLLGEDFGMIAAGALEVLRRRLSKSSFGTGGAEWVLDAIPAMLQLETSDVAGVLDSASSMLPLGVISNVADV